MNLDFTNKKILLFVDYNVPIVDGTISSTFKIDQSMDTINLILSNHPKSLFILSHLGRPSLESISTIPIYNSLINKIDDLKYEEIKKIETIQNGVFFLDNLRHYSIKEIQNFSKKFDLIVNDSFASSHRQLPIMAYPGLLMKREITQLKKAAEADLIIIGGGKIKDKIKLLNNPNKLIFVGGCLAITIYHFLGKEMGNSKYEKVDCKFLIEKIENKTIILPVDFRVITKNGIKIKSIENINKDDIIIDIGPKSFAILENVIEKSKIIVWNGPMGKFEDPNAKSTFDLINILSITKNVIAGGGETSLCICKSGHYKDFYFVSTGGGAMVSFISGEEMPALDFLIIN